MGTTNRAILDPAEARLPRWMAALAAGVGLTALVMGQWKFAAGFTLGAALAILAYSWLHQAVAAVLGSGVSRPPKLLVAKVVVRYPAAFGVIYFFHWTAWLPFRAIIAGLFVPVAGVLLECVFQLGQAFRQ